MKASTETIFLDRDGVLIREKPDYVKAPEEMEILPGVADTLRRLTEERFRLIIVTNQSAVNRGLMTVESLTEIHRVLVQELLANGAKIDGIYFCPHRPEEDCACRKPRPGMLLEAGRDFSVDFENSWMIGDKDSDIEAGLAVGCKVLKVETNMPSALGKAVSQILNTRVGGLANG